MTQLGLWDMPPNRTPRSLVPPRSFHVSSPRTTVTELREGERKAAGQDAFILDVFRKHGAEDWTPSELTHHVNLGRLAPWPITSVRRSLTNLTRRGHLRRLMARRMGPLGSQEHAWSLAE